MNKKVSSVERGLKRDVAKSKKALLKVAFLYANSDVNDVHHMTRLLSSLQLTAFNYGNSVKHLDKLKEGKK